MKCPFRIIAAASTQTPYSPELHECYQAACAWWDTNQKRCFMDGIDLSLARIAVSLRDIASKTPLGGAK